MYMKMWTESLSLRKTEDIPASHCYTNIQIVPEKNVSKQLFSRKKWWFFFKWVQIQVCQHHLCLSGSMLTYNFTIYFPIQRNRVRVKVTRTISNQSWQCQKCLFLESKCKVTKFTKDDKHFQKGTRKNS